jgi:hypothetical protein
VLTCWLGVPRSTITRAVGEVRPLLAERGCTVEDGIRLHTRADVIAHPGCQRAAWPAGCHRGEGAPPGGPLGRPDSVVLGKARTNTVKALVITDAEGRWLFCGQIRPSSIHDLTQVRQAGLVELLARKPGVTPGSGSRGHCSPRLPQNPA